VKGVVFAWAAGMGIMAWREYQQYHKPVVPGRLLGGSLVYAGLALLSEWQPAARVATLTAWAFTLAVAFEVGPAQLTSTKGLTTNAQSPLSTQPLEGQAA
jgi:hypothetical protein